MYRKRYTNITALIEGQGAECVDFDAKWRIFSDLGGECYLMVRNISGKIEFAPLFIHSFPLLMPHKALDAEKFNLRFNDPSKIVKTADKLRWCRYKNALRQKDVAEAVGIDRTTYKRYEEVGHEYYPRDVMERIAELFGVPVEGLLDDYNLFLYRDQGRQIKEKRLELGMTQRKYADRLGVPYASLGRWERNIMRIAKGTWERLFRRQMREKA